MKAVPILTLIGCFLANYQLYGQCTGGTSAGALSPAPAAAYQTATVNAGNYYTFTVPAFTTCETYTYTFTFCNNGGTAGFDTQITILDNTGTPVPLGYNDDNCGLQSQLVWTATAPGTYRLLISNYPCGSSGASGTLAYNVNISNGLYGPYCLTNDAIPITVPGYSNCAQFTAEVNNQIGCVWNVGTISFANPFDYQVDVYFGNNVNGADGATFSFQNAPSGISTCGSAGGQLGMGGVPNAVVVEFDTYDNDNPAHIYDMSADHTAIEIDGNLQGPGPPLCGPVQASAISPVIDDGLMHAIRITWNPGTNTMQTYFDGNLRLTCVYDFINNVFGGNPNVYWGFTGATGGLNNQQYFCPVSIPLPVDLVDFSAQCNEGFVKLDWVTATEVNNAYFEVQRSHNAINYEVVGRKNGHGNSNQTLHYEYVDTVQQVGTTYYRLVQYDFNGENKAYNPISTDCDASFTSGLNVNYALTTNYGILLDFTTLSAGTHQISVYDMKGNQLANYSSGFASGNHQQSLVIPNLSGGVYMIVIENARDIDSRKFLYQTF